MFQIKSHSWNVIANRVVLSVVHLSNGHEIQHAESNVRGRGRVRGVRTGRVFQRRVHQYCGCL